MPQEPVSPHGAGSDGALWRPVPAALITVAILLMASGIALVVTGALRTPEAGSDGTDLETAPIAHGAEMILLVWQASIVGMVLLAAARPGGNALHYLGLDRPTHRRQVAIGMAGLLALVAPYNLAVFVIDRASMISDLEMFAQGLRSPTRWLLAAAICVGAPMAEEMLFRGFLLPALARSRLGFWGAAVASTLGWTALHIGNSIFGLMEIFLIGLYLSWLFRQTANLWVTIASHAAYNSVLTIVLMSGVTGL